MRMTNGLLSKFVRRFKSAGMAALAFSAASFSTAPAMAQDYPSEPVHWIITSGTGGSFYRLAQGLAPALGEALGVDVVVEAVPGPDGWNRVYLAEPDGYTIGMGDPVGEFGNAAVSELPYDPHELTWVGRINSASNLIVASKPSGFTSLDDLKAASESVRIGSFGVTAPLIQLILLSDAAGVPITPVNFRTPGDVVFGLVRGDVDVANLGARLWLEHIEAGNAMPILLWDENADPNLTDVPTLPDAGMPELVDFMAQRSVIAPPDLPEDILAKLEAAFSEAVASEKGRAFLESANFEQNTLMGAEFREIVGRIAESIDSKSETLKGFVAN